MTVSRMSLGCRTHVLRLSQSIFVECAANWWALEEDWYIYWRQGKSRSE